VQPPHERHAAQKGEFLADGRCLHDNTGLKGKVASWAREKLELGHYENRLERIQSTPDGSALDDALSRSTAVVYAVGFKRNPLPEIVLADGSVLHVVRHNNTTGQYNWTIQLDRYLGHLGFGDLASHSLKK
jgi:hypothetical protein